MKLTKLLDYIIQVYDINNGCKNKLRLLETIVKYIKFLKLKPEELMFDGEKAIFNNYRIEKNRELNYFKSCDYFFGYGKIFEYYHYIDIEYLINDGIELELTD